jgi:hypothetical protein
MPDGSRLVNFECKSNMCTVESVQPNDAHYREFLLNAFLYEDRRVWHTQGATTRANPDARAGSPLEIVTYFSRDGQTLPELAPQ